MILSPLTINMPTAELSRPSVAKVSIQLDLLKKLLTWVWLECGDSLLGFWQTIEYDKVPKYCQHYMRLSYDICPCKTSHPPSKGSRGGENLQTKREDP